MWGGHEDDPPALEASLAAEMVQFSESVPFKDWVGSLYFFFFQFLSFN